MSIIEKTDLFVSSENGYHSYRIPSLLATSQGSLLAFCEARKHSRSDSGDIDIVARRSVDGGHTWGEMKLVADAGDDVFGNPCPVQDRLNGVIWLPLCWNLADGGEGAIFDGDAVRTIWMVSSEDDGVTWSAPVEITDNVMKPNWNWYATGPGHGIQLVDGRMVVPCDFGAGPRDAEGNSFGSHIIYSDDYGASWHIGGEIYGKLNECQVVELTDGSLVLNMRSYHGKNRRAVARSTDRGDTWSEIEFDDALMEPVCQAAIHRLSDGSVVFSNPASVRRECMTLRRSTDGCRTWEVLSVLHEGPSAYSDLAQYGDDILCLYEQGVESAYDCITLARFGLDQLL